jgi:hypothetical protein
LASGAIGGCPVVATYMPNHAFRWLTSKTRLISRILDAK